MAKTERKLISAPDESPDAPYPKIPAASEFEDRDADFLRAKDLEAMAVLLMDEYDDLAPLRGLKIGFAWKRAGGGSNGTITLGKCVKASGLTRFYSDCDIVIWLAADHLRQMNEHPTPTAEEGPRLPATWWQVEAVMYHELKHPRVDEETGKSRLQGHDLEAFVDEIKEYGPWKESIEVMRAAFKQLPLGLV